MANRKGFYIFLTSILCLVAVIFSVTFAYSYFVFDTRESEDEPKVLVDDIYENYNLTSEGTLQEDLYTVYFIAQPIIANDLGTVEEDNPENHEPSMPENDGKNSGISAVYATTSGSGGKYDGFFSEATEINTGDPRLGRTSVTTSTSTYGGIHYLKKAENVFQGLTTDLLDAIGRPLCNKKDFYGYGLTFVGWSANKSIAATDGYASQADFNIVDTRTPLSEYDTANDGSGAADDGSGVNDNIIYLYAIYTTGKDYSKYNESGDIKYPNDQNVNRYDAVKVELSYKDSEDKTNTFEYWPSRELFTSSDGNQHEYFVFNNLSITDEQLNDENFRFNVNAGPVNDRGWDGDWLGGTATDIGITQEGHYNIYVFVFTDRDLYDDRGDRGSFSNFNNDVLDRIQEEYLDWENLKLGSENLTLDEQFKAGKNIILSGKNIQGESAHSGMLRYRKDANLDRQEGGLFGSYYGPAYHLGGFYFYVERIYEFKMIGGNSETFNYDDTSLNYFFDQDGTNTYFEAHNVFFNNMGLDYEYEFEDGSTLQTNHSVFGVVHEKVLPTYEITLSTNAQLYLEVAEEGEDYFINDLSENNLSANLKGKLFKINYTGYYNFDITVSYNSEGGISSLTLDIGVRHSDMFIKITDKDLVDRSDDMFIIHNDFDSNYQRTNNDGTTTRLLFNSIGIKTNNYISGDWQFNQYFEYSGGDWIKLSTPKVVTLNDIVNMLENLGLNLTSHLTKNVIPRSTILDPESPYLVSKSYLWYVS